MSKVLFLLRKNEVYGTNTENTKSGLRNSALMTMKQLEDWYRVETKLEVCFDSNSIDKEVTEYRPDFVVIEALWVPPYKFHELIKLHKNVKWLVRIHSETPFLANEGIAIPYITGYIGINNVFVCFNSFKTAIDFTKTFNYQFYYLPNIYEHVRSCHTPWFDNLVKTGKYLLDNGNKLHFCNRYINVGCFGAIRPMKNQLIQAMAAISLGNRFGRKILFHINTERVEQKGDSVLKNLRSLFKNKEHELIEHDWLERERFLHLVSQMDIGLQVSLNESFNIVAADFVKEKVPIVVSETIGWMPNETKTNTEYAQAIANKMVLALNHSDLFIDKGRDALAEYNHKAILSWDVVA